MSLVALKRKSQTKYGKLSSRGNNGFSLNNPRRVDSHANQHQTQTLMKGLAPRGHGSCCGKFPRVINKSQYVNYDLHERQYLGDKSNQGISVKNHTGSIATRHKWLKRGYPYSVVKNMHPFTADIYIKQKKEKCSDNLGTETYTQDTCEGNTSCNKKYSNFVKKVEVMDYSEYLITKLQTKNCLPTPKDKEHYPKPINGTCNSCNIEN
jgi:hypothetical protein